MAYLVACYDCAESLKSTPEPKKNASNWFIHVSISKVSFLPMYSAGLLGFNVILLLNSGTWKVVLAGGLLGVGTLLTWVYTASNCLVSVAT